MPYIGIDARPVEIGRTRICIRSERRDEYRGRRTRAGQKGEVDWVDESLIIFAEDLETYTVGIIAGTRTLLVKKDDVDIVPSNRAW